ncbi:MAG: metallophosphoesterase [Nitrosopumilus sp. H13]|nr:MAG: metallophosphoesterase [Nitrosopumilus sp. H13]
MQRIRIIPSSPALLAEGRRRILAVADLHLGFEAGLAANGIFVGKNSAARQTAEEIECLIDSQEPDSVVLLGDVKSSVRGISKSEWDEVPAFFERICRKCDVVLVPGNHDSNIERLVPDAVTMTGPSGMIEEDTLFTHGHAMPSDNFGHVGRIVMGHAHPTYIEEGSVLNGQRVWASMQAQKGDIFPSRTGSIEVIVMPSFNRYFFATHKKHSKSTSPIIRRIGECRARITTLDGSIIGDESALDRVV